MFLNDYGAIFKNRTVKNRNKYISCCFIMYVIVCMYVSIYLSMHVFM